MAEFGRRHIEIWLPLAVLLLDQVSKALVRQNLALHDSVVVIPGVLDFTHVQNTGAAFGIFNLWDFPYKTALLVAIATAGLVGVAVYSASLHQSQRLARIGLALIIGGAAGNLLDRLVLGHVVDFVDAYWGTWHFWAFNVADAAINVGVAVMIIDMFWTPRTGTHD